MSVLPEASTICVVDSQPEDYVSMLADPLLEGLNLRFFRTAGAALRAARRDEPSLWFINMDLPDRSGIELCKMLRSRFDEVPMYLVRNEYDVEAELEARSCGATMFLCKPVASHWLQGTDTTVAK